MTDLKMKEAFNQLINLQNKCDEAFADFNAILENHKNQSHQLRNSISPESLFGKSFFVNRPHKWGNIEKLALATVEPQNRNFFYEDKGSLKILPYFKHLEAYDSNGIANFIGQFQEFSPLFDMNPGFFSEDSQFLVLWAEDMEYDVDEGNIFNSPNLIYEYAIFKL